MQYALAALALAASSVLAFNTPAPPPPGCLTTFSGNFEIAPVNISTHAKRDILGNFKRQAVPACSSNPIIDLKNGVLIDQANRQGEIVANHQFQFDDILQPDALFVTGFSVCPNNTLASGGSTVFWACNSGSFANLYDASLGGQCYQIYIDVIPCSGGTSATNTAVASTSAPATSSSVTSTPASSTPATSAPTTSSVGSVTVITPIASITPATSAPAPPPSAKPTVVVPYPVGNGTAPAASGTASAGKTSTATGGSPSKSSPITAPANGAGALAVGGKIAAAAAGIAAFAML